MIVVSSVKRYNKLRLTTLQKYINTDTVLSNKTVTAGNIDGAWLWFKPDGNTGHHRIIRLNQRMAESELCTTDYPGVPETICDNIYQSKILHSH